ncbi:MAG: hypothetical protein IT373_25255 [Polyangiaceae bacterium]|nr:hypothetical protein [Polyangiaceae bacterium]
MKLLPLALPLALAPLALGGCFLFTPAQGTGGPTGPTGVGPTNGPAPSSAGPSASEGATTSGGAAQPEPQSTHYSLSLHNSCKQTVKLFIGEKPPFSSGTNTSLGSNTTTSYSGSAPENIWIVDDAGKPMSSYTSHPGSQTMQILESCTGFSTY